LLLLTARGESTPRYAAPVAAPLPPTAPRPRTSRPASQGRRRSLPAPQDRPDGGPGRAVRRGRRSSEGLPRVEGIAHAFEDEDEEREHDGKGEEGREAEPGRLQVRLALQRKLEIG